MQWGSRWVLGSSSHIWEIRGDGMLIGSWTDAAAIRSTVGSANHGHWTDRGLWQLACILTWALWFWIQKSPFSCFLLLYPKPNPALVHGAVLRPLLNTSGQWHFDVTSVINVRETFEFESARLCQPPVLTIYLTSSHYEALQIILLAGTHISTFISFFPPTLVCTLTLSPARVHFQLSLCY